MPPVILTGPPGMFNVWGRLWLNDCGYTRIEAGGKTLIVAGKTHEYPEFGLTVNSDKPLKIVISPGKDCEKILFYDLQVHEVAVPRSEKLETLITIPLVLLLISVLWHFLAVTRN